MSFGFRIVPAVVFAALLLLAPGHAFADRKDGEKQRSDRSYDQAWPASAQSEKEWRKEQKEREKDRREAWREREKDRREAAREYDKDQREAESEWRKDQRESAREWEKDRREAAREARKQGRDRNYRYPRTNRYPIP